VNPAALNRRRFLLFGAAALTGAALCAAPAAAYPTSYGGFVYDDHTPTTRLSTNSIPVNGSFRVTSTTMRFHGQPIFVLLEDVNRIPGSSGVTRFRLPNVRYNSNSLLIAGPDLGIFRNRTFRVVVSTWEGGRPQYIAMPGTITFR
jgi:hypothetical protein